MEIKSFVFNSFQVNTYLLFSEKGEGFVIDPACSNDGEFNMLEGFIKEKEIGLKAVINTHCHVDHLLGVNYLREKYNIPFFCHKEEDVLIKHAEIQATVFGFNLSKPAPADRHLNESDSLELDSEKIEFRHVPGHSPGSLVIYVKTQDWLITGDVLFSASIGRTDLPGGNYQQLINGINEKLFILPDETEVFPGHGPSTTIGFEKRNNPFFQ